MRERDYAQQRASRSGLVQDLNDYKKLRNKVTNRLRKEKVNWKQEQLEACKDDSGLQWKNILGWLKWKPSGGPPTQVFCNGTIENKPKRIANCMNEFFVKKVKNIIDSLPKPKYDPLSILNQKESVSSMFSLQPVHPDVVEGILRGLKNSKSCGVDFLDTATLKLIASEITPALTHIINLSIRFSTFPSAWKHAKVIPLHKKGDTLDPKNYRPVAILPVLSKILERVVFEQTVYYFEANQLFHPNHHGFRKCHNTCTALLQMFDNWVEAAEGKKVSAVCMLDMSAAFDVVNHDILLRKLHFYGFDDNSLQWMLSYLTSRTQSVCIDSSMSNPLEITTGVPQGSILGPLSYIIYTRELPDVIFTCGNHQNPGTFSYLNNTMCSSCGSVCCFADDSTLTVFGSNPADLERKLTDKFTSISDFLTSSKLKLNEEKTNLMLMATQSKRRFSNMNIQLTTNSGIIYTSESNKLLGAQIHQDLKWSDHILEVVKSLNMRLNGLKNVCKHANFKTRLMVANGIFISKLIYLIPLWGGSSKFLINMIQVVQNKAARYVTKKGIDEPVRELLKQCNWLSVNQLIEYHSILTVHSTLVSSYPVYLRNKFNSDFPKNTRQATQGKLRHSVFSGANLSLTTSSFTWRAIQSFNSLPMEIRTEKRRTKFKKAVKKWILDSIDL